MASTGDIWYPPPLHPVTKLYSILPCWVEGVEIDDGSKSFHTYMSINSAHSYPHIQRVEKLPRENRKKEEGVGRRRLYLTLVTSVYTGLGQSLKNLEPFVQDDSVNANCDWHFFIYWWMSQIFDINDIFRKINFLTLIGCTGETTHLTDRTAPDQNGLVDQNEIFFVPYSSQLHPVFLISSQWRLENLNPVWFMRFN